MPSTYDKLVIILPRTQNCVLQLSEFMQNSTLIIYMLCAHLLNIFSKFCHGN